MAITYAIKTAPAVQLGIEELILAEAFLGLMINQIEANERQVPAALTADLRDVSRELESRLRDKDEAEYKALMLRRQSLMPVDEKRAALDAEINKLAKKLGKPAVATMKGTSKAAVTKRVR